MNERILVIDDTPANIQTVAAILKGQGYQLSVATNGKQALGVVEKIRPDLILLDVMMPGMDGPATFRELQKNPATAHIPVMLLTAKVQATDRSRFADLGVKAVLVKPFDPMGLSQQVAEILGWS